MCVPAAYVRMITPTYHGGVTGDVFVIFFVSVHFFSFFFVYYCCLRSRGSRFAVGYERLGRRPRPAHPFGRRGRYTLSSLVVSRVVVPPDVTPSRERLLVSKPNFSWE